MTCLKKTKSFLLLILLITASSLLYSEEFYNAAIGYYLDIPEGWFPVDDADPAFLAFASPDSSAILQIFAFPGMTFDTVDTLYGSIKSGLKAVGDGGYYNYSGRDAIFADLSFNNGNSSVRGYFVFINSLEMDYVLIAYSQTALYEVNHDFLLSCIDSFAYNSEEKFVPGPVSQFFYPFPAENKEPVQLKINGITVNTELDMSELDAAFVLIEREARILTTYSDYDEFLRAWGRYYRIIYKDNYLRLAEIVELLKDNFRLQQKSSRDKVLMILNWIQNFEYYRTGTTSDLTSPIETAYQMAGDCDSRALLFIILLDYLNIDSVLLVSTEYSHSAVGVDVSGNGAKIRFNNKDYLFAELTETVELGLVESSMADPSGWITIPLGK